VAALEEWVTWTSWRGSPDLVRHIAETTTRKIGGKPELKISVSLLEDQEVFCTPAAFADEVTPEALRDFHRLDVLVRDPRMSIDITFQRRRRGAPFEDVDGRVKLSIRCFSPDHKDQALAVARAVCAALKRGHRRLFGRTEGSDGIPSSWRGPSLPRPAGATVIARALVGFAFALVVLSTISTLFPDAKIAPVVTGIIACVSGLGSARLLPTLVPSIEIAEPGKTRLWQTTRWFSVTVLGLLIAQIAKKVL